MGLILLIETAARKLRGKRRLPAETEVRGVDSWPGAHDPGPEVIDYTPRVVGLGSRAALRSLKPQSQTSNPVHVAP